MYEELLDVLHDLTGNPVDVLADCFWPDYIPLED